MEAHLARHEALLSAQHGLLTLAQLREAGLTDEARRRLVERRTLRRIRPRVYALVGARDTWERGLLAAVLSVDGAIASHAAAARLWRLSPRPEACYEITIALDGRLAPRRGVSIHRSTKLDDEDRAVRDGIPCTSFERTLCDCTTRLGLGQLGRALDDGLRRNVASLPRLHRCAERLESGPGRHMSLVRKLLSERGIGFDPGGSRSELEMLDVFRRAGLPAPVQQFPVRVAGRMYRPDFAWPDGKVFAEFYGMAFHTGASAVVSDSERLTALSSAGWLPLVFTHASTDHEIIERTSLALARRGVWRDSGR